MLNDENAASIQLFSPNGNESWHGNRTIEWSITPSGSLTNHTVTIQYQYAYSLWETLVDNRENITTPFIWDTTTVPDGYPYIIKVILKKDDDLDGIYETLISEDTSDAPFAIDNSATSKGWVHGVVVDESNNTILPIEDAVVCLILSDINNVVTSKCAYTNGSGEYIIPIRAGTYTITASKIGYKTTIVSDAMVWANETTELNFSLEPGTSSYKDLFFIEENREMIQTAIEEEEVGGEVTIRAEEDETKVLIYKYNAVSIQPKTIDSSQITLLVNGDETSAGKAIVINFIGDFVDQNDKIVIEYDGETITMADDLFDALNANDDGSHPEYLITIGEDGTQLIITMPHFSEHEITIYIVEEAVEILGGITAIILYIVLLVAFATVTAIPIIRLWRKIE